ncbi:MAG: hypothetical protein AUH44_00905 [Chloroflexi bacterium 13_1_40CM_68_15]|nr:MAG: hypothetical protein AUH44_00905 [Chloroflexi bacterium 13_1_40CM_68_15]
MDARAERGLERARGRLHVVRAGAGERGDRGAADLARDAGDRLGLAGSRPGPARRRAAWCRRR